MKKLVTLLLAVVMTFTCVACGNSGNNGGSNSAIKEANDILTAVWTDYTKTAGEDLQFPVGGGNFEEIVMDASGKYDVTLTDAKEGLTVSFCIPGEAIDMTDDVATVMNMMMANNFSSAAYHVTDAANVETVVAGIKDATLNNQWMCGFPEKLIIVTINDDYVVSAFGNGQVIDAYKASITNVYGDAAVVSVEENLMQ